MSKKQIVRCGLKEAFDSNYLFIRWEFNKFCNLNCSYCNLHNNIKKFESNENMIKVVDFISSFEREFINISITGGEPTVNPNFINIMELLVYKINNFSKKKLSLFTNLTSKKNIMTELWSKSISKFNGSFRLNCSYHSENTDFNFFKTNLQHCIDLGFDIIVRFMIDSNNLEIIKKQYFELKEMNCVVIPEFLHKFNYNNLILQWYESIDIPMQNDRVILIDYLDENKNIYREFISNDKINYYQLYKCKGFYCSVGKKHLFIRDNCNVSLCYSYEQLVGPIFNIITTTEEIINRKLKLYDKPIRCLNKECYCENWVPRYIEGYKYINDT